MGGIVWTLGVALLLTLAALVDNRAKLLRMRRGWRGMTDSMARGTDHLRRRLDLQRAEVVAAREAAAGWKLQAQLAQDELAKLRNAAK